MFVYGLFFFPQRIYKFGDILCLQLFGFSSIIFLWCGNPFVRFSLQPFFLLLFCTFSVHWFFFYFCLDFSTMFPFVSLIVDPLHCPPFPGPISSTLMLLSNLSTMGGHVCCAFPSFAFFLEVHFSYLLSLLGGFFSSRFVYFWLIPILVLVGTSFLRTCTCAGAVGSLSFLSFGVPLFFLCLMCQCTPAVIFCPLNLTFW